VVQGKRPGVVQGKRQGVVQGKRQGVVQRKGRVGNWSSMRGMSRTSRLANPRLAKLRLANLRLANLRLANPPPQTARRLIPPHPLPTPCLFLRTTLCLFLFPRT
jgi:hypothetical protein